MIPLYRRIARTFEAYVNCAQNGNTLWRDEHKADLETVCESMLPHGSGFDGATTLDMDRSRIDRLVFVTEFHHMDGNGLYDGWTEHDIIVTPSLSAEFSVRVTGRDRNDIKDYITELFVDALDTYVPEFGDIKPRRYNVRMSSLGAAVLGEDGIPVGPVWKDYRAAEEYARALEREANTRERDKT